MGPDEELAVRVNPDHITTARARRTSGGQVWLDLELVTGTVIHCKAPDENAANKLAERFDLVLLRHVSHVNLKG